MTPSVSTSKTCRRRPDGKRRPVVPSSWLGDLVGCPYCVSHWLTAAAVLIYRPRLVELWCPLDLLVTALAMVAFTAVVVGFIKWAQR